jgi:hypothetical protein
MAEIDSEPLGGEYIDIENVVRWLATYIHSVEMNSEINIYKVTIPSSGWVATQTRYTQDVSTSSSMGVNSTIVSVIPNPNSTAAQKAAFEQWDSIETKAGGITITAPVQISTDFGIVIIETPEAN